MDRLWQAFLRCFDLEHTFRLFKQVLGWTAPKLRDPAAADRWTWLIITAHTHLRLARPLAEDLRLPGNAPPPQATDPGPRPPGIPEHPRGGRPAGQCTETRETRPGHPLCSKNRRLATRYDVGKDQEGTRT